MLKQKGLSLVELMIGITLGLILLTGVMQVFLSSKNVFTSQQALSRVQESGRMAIEFLSRDIRMAGFMGCASRSDTIKVNNMLNNSDTVTFNFVEAIRGWDQSKFPTVKSSITQTIAENTDVVVLRSAVGSGVYVMKNNDGAQLFVNDTGDSSRTCKSGTSFSGLCREDLLVITDCEKANVFQAGNVRAGVSGAADDKVNIVHSNATMSPGNAVASWGGNSDKQNTFNAGSQILSATSNIYFIADGSSEPKRPSLWQNSNGVSLELLEGVEDMHLTYGIDTELKQDYIPNEYKLAGDVTNWERVVSVRVELLVASIEDNVTADHQVYTFPSDAKASTTAGDYRLRQIFSSTIAIRNRIN